MAPRLMAVATAMLGDLDEAADAAQAALFNAWRARADWDPAVSFSGWLFRKLREAIQARLRLRAHRSDGEAPFGRGLGALPDAQTRLAFEDMTTALGKLTHDQREALLLIVAADLSYEEASRVTGAPVGTLRSRVRRGRELLAALIDLDVAGEAVGPAEDGSIRHKRS